MRSFLFLSNRGQTDKPAGSLPSIPFKIVSRVDAISSSYVVAGLNMISDQGDLIDIESLTDGDLTQQVYAMMYMSEDMSSWLPSFAMNITSGGDRTMDLLLPTALIAAQPLELVRVEVSPMDPDDPAGEGFALYNPDRNEYVLLYGDMSTTDIRVGGSSLYAANVACWWGAYENLYFHATSQPSSGALLTACQKIGHVTGDVVTLSQELSQNGVPIRVTAGMESSSRAYASMSLPFGPYVPLKVGQNYLYMTQDGWWVPMLRTATNGAQTLSSISAGMNYGVTPSAVSRTPASAIDADLYLVAVSKGVSSVSPAMLRTTLSLPENLLPHF